MKIALYIPNNLNKPVPVLMRLGFDKIEGENIEMSNIQAYGRLNNGTPLIDFLDKGFGVVCIQGGEVIGNEISFKNFFLQKKSKYA